MYEFLSQISSFAPIVIFIATILDVFFISGYLLYGVAMTGSVLIMYTSGMISIPMIFLTAFTGTVIGSVINFWCGRFLSETQFISKRLKGPRVARVQSILKTRGLFVFMIFGRSVTFTRPIYSLVIGSLDIRFRRFFLYEVIISFFWISFWLSIIVQGETLAMWLFDKI